MYTRNNDFGKKCIGSEKVKTPKRDPPSEHPSFYK